MKKIKNLILDYGNVLFEIDFNRAQESFTKLGIKDIENFFSHKSHHSLFNDFETGFISPDQFRDGIREISGNNSLTDQEIDYAWNSLLIGIPDYSIHELLLELKTKYRLFLLSNNNEIHYQWIMQYLLEKWNLRNYDDHFEKAYFSQQMLLRKPNREIFERVIHEQGLNPEETLFIDDSPQHIEGAKLVGLNTLLMDVKPVMLRQFLINNHIL